MISGAVRTNLAMYLDVALGGAIMEGSSPKIIKFGFKEYLVNDDSKKRTVVCKFCSSKISDTTTSSKFTRHYKIHKDRYVNVPF